MTQKPMWAVLKGKRVKPCSPSEWRSGAGTVPVHVAENYLGEVRVSTVFLGLNHGFLDKDLWFETMIFGGEHDGHQARYETWDEAEAGHAEALRMIGGLT